MSNLQPELRRPQVSSFGNRMNHPATRQVTHGGSMSVSSHDPGKLTGPHHMVRVLSTNLKVQTFTLMS